MIVRHRLSALVAALITACFAATSQDFADWRMPDEQRQNITTCTDGVSCIPAEAYIS